MQNGHPITSHEPAHLAGKTVAHSYTWSDTKRAQLAAKATFGAVIVSPLTAAQAAEIFGVPTTAVTAELKKLGVALRHTNGNGHTATPSVPAWEALTSEQRSEFLTKNFDAIFHELERVTA